MRLTKFFAAISLVSGVAFVSPASASLISGFGLPSSNAALTGATVVDFSAVSTGTYTSLTVGGVTFSGDNGNFVVTDSLGGSYNTLGRNLQNLQVQGSASILSFNFSSAVSAFGFNFGASNEDWLLEAFDSGNNLLESHTLTQTWFSNAGDYFGIAASGISYARATQLTHVNDSGVDWILLDNLAYSGDSTNRVPEPESMALASIALLALAASRRRKE
jgi:hypothetical protein